MNKKYYNSNEFQKCVNYFSENSLGKLDKEKIESLGAKFLNEEETWKLPFQNLFETLISYSDGEQVLNQSLPLPMWCNIAFPYELDEHEDIFIEDKTLEQIITQFINQNFNSEKFIFSGNSNSCITITIKEFKYEYFNIINKHNSNSSIILFDKNFNKAFIYTYRSSISIITQELEADKFILDGKSRKFWGDFFCKHYQAGYRWAMADGRLYTKEDFKYLISDYGGRLSHALPSFNV